MSVIASLVVVAATIGAAQEHLTAPNSTINIIAEIKRALQGQNGFIQVLEYLSMSEQELNAILWENRSGMSYKLNYS